MVHLNVIVTDWATVRVSEATAAAMDRVYPGWQQGYLEDGRTLRGKRAREGAEKLVAAARFISELNDAIGAEVEEI